jgi:hypothetical protein
VTQDDDLDEPLGLLKLIPEMLRAFGDLDSADLDVGIDDALRRIGTFASVDRCLGAWVGNGQRCWRDGPVARVVVGSGS